MFQRKSNLPTRPSIPTKEEIQEDLSCANIDDIVFKTEAELNTTPASDALNDESEEMDEYDQKNTTKIRGPDQAYSKISSFVDKMNHLEERLTALKKEKGNLSKLEESLLADMAHIQEELKKQSSQ